MSRAEGAGKSRTRVVVKIGSASISRPDGGLDRDAFEEIVASLDLALRDDAEVCVVSSGAIAAGLPALGLVKRPRQIEDLQVLAAVGQSELMRAYSETFAARGRVVGQVLLTALDFAERRHYLNARNALLRMLELGVIPVINENDTVATDEIRFGDNDRLGALVSQLVGASLYLILTDTEGVYTADPRLDASATLIEEVSALDEEMIRFAGGAGSELGSGGMLSKLLASRIAAWSGIRCVIAHSRTQDVVRRALRGESVGTEIKPHSPPLPSRKAWIAFGTFPCGKIEVDKGAERALKEKGASLLPVGVRKVEGSFEAGDAVEIAAGGEVFAKGIVRMDAASVRQVAGKRTEELAVGVEEIVHRDDLVVFPSS
jgi:glutamate 5-kinase